MFTNATNKFWSLVMTALADVDGFKICIQVCMWQTTGFGMNKTLAWSLIYTKNLVWLQD